MHGWGKACAAASPAERETEQQLKDHLFFWELKCVVHCYPQAKLINAISKHSSVQSDCAHSSGFFQSLFLYTIMWPADPKLPSIRGFVLPWNFVCTLCGDGSSGWEQLWSVPVLKLMTDTSHCLYQLVNAHVSAELSVLELQWFFRRDGF